MPATLKTEDEMTESLDASKIIDLLKEMARNQLTAALGSKKLEAFAIGEKGNFPYNWQSTLNVTQFNKTTYEWIASNLKAGASPIQQDASFTNLYQQALSSISYSLSSSDQSALNTASSNATVQGAALQTAWIAAYGALPAVPSGSTPVDAILGEIMTKWTTSATTTLSDIQNSINLQNLLGKTPASGQPVLPVFASYLNALGASLSLQNSVTMNTAYLNRALAAVQAPSAANGALTLSDASIVPAYQIEPKMGQIQNSMQSGKPVVSLEMDVKRSTDSEFSVKIGAEEGITIPILDIVTIGITASQNYFSSNIATTDNETKVTLYYPGANLVTFGPSEFQMTGSSKNWFWMDPIRQAIANSGKDVSGYKFSPDPKIDFSASGPFGYLSGVVISSYPTIEIKVKSANYQRIEIDFSQSSTTTVSVFGIQLASLTESTCSKQVTVDASSQTVTITLSPPPTLVSSPVNDAVGWVLGAVRTYPAA
jgi:hypothetical protein